MTAGGRSLLERLPEIVAEGKRYAGQVLERLEGSDRISLQTREQVIPSRDSRWRDLLGKQGRVGDARRLNRLIYGDNLLAMAALLAGDGATPCLRGKIDLIYIDPPFDSKADYRTQIEVLGNEMEHKPTVIEQFAYADTWHEGTLSYLSMLTPRLCLMRELLSDKGSLYVHLDWHVSHYVKIVMDEIFGKESFLNEIVWKRRAGILAQSKQYGTSTDSILFYKVSDEYYFNHPTIKVGRDEYIEERFKYIDSDARRYRLSPLVSPSYSRNLVYEYKGCQPPKKWMVCIKRKNGTI